MRASTLLLVVTASTSCRLNSDYNGLGDWPLIEGSSTTDPSVSGTGDVLPTSGPIATVTGPDATDGETGAVMIVEVMLPDTATAAGPLQLGVRTENAMKVAVSLDQGAWTAEASGEEMLWSFGIPVLGAIDEGSHEVDVVATGASGEATWHGSFVVAVPDPGQPAWTETIKEPAGVTRALAVAPNGDIVEAGSTEVDGATRVSVRRRSAEDGSEAWPEKTIVLWPELEGSAEGVATTPDGKIWVAANVNANGLPQHPRLALLDGDGAILWFHEGAEGQRMNDVAADAEGGCVAVGSTPAGETTDAMLWLVGPDGGVRVSPSLKCMPGSFDDVLEGVTIIGDTAIVGGHAAGPFDGDPDVKSSRGCAGRFMLHSGIVVGSAWIAPADGLLKQSWIRSLSAHPDGGWLVAGEACEFPCVTRKLEIGRFSAAGERVSLVRDEQPIGSWAEDVAVDSQGRVLVAANFEMNGGDAHAQARLISSSSVMFEHVYPSGAMTEEVTLAIVVDAYDRPFYAGYATGGGGRQVFLVRLHP